MINVAKRNNAPSILFLIFFISDTYYDFLCLPTNTARKLSYEGFVLKEERSRSVYLIFVTPCADFVMFLI